MNKVRVIGKINYLVNNRKSTIHGTGAFAAEQIPARKKIGALAGIIISKRMARQKASALRSVSIVELWNGKALDASDHSNALKFINHSCHPNTYMRTMGHHVEFYALRAIRPGEELTCGYGLTHHEGQLPCRCGHPHCKGFL